MRRALTLIITLTLLSFGVGAYLDDLQHDTAERYLAQLDHLRALLLKEDFSKARLEQAHIHALWQHDERWLKCMVSHHHTRAVSEALLKLATALEQRWADEALLALDEAVSALLDVQYGYLPTLSNVL